MSRISAVLGKGFNDESSAQGPRSCEYTALIQRLSDDLSTVAIIGSGCNESAKAVCEGIATELSRMERSVVLVSVLRLLEMNPALLPEDTAFMPGCARNIWLWPSTVGQQIELFKPGSVEGKENWLESLRRNFDSVLLDCPAVEAAQGVTAIAAMADTAVLAVEAARTPKQKILRDQRMLQSSGVKLAGCVLINGK